MRQLSGIAVMRSAGDSAVCAAVSDKDPVIYEIHVPLPVKTDAAETPLPARRLRDIPAAVDLEDVAFDKNRNALWVSSEGRAGGLSVVYRVPLDPAGPVVSFPIDSVPNAKNTGAEGIALVPTAHGDELWVARERYTPPDATPPVFRYAIGEDGRLGACVGRFELGLIFHRTQSGMTHDPRSRHVWIISRELRILYAVKGPFGTRRTVTPDSLSCTYTWDDLLNNHTKFGMAEGVAFDQSGNLFVAFDNNEDLVGTDPAALSGEPRLIALRARR
jgi:hypothetical protein